MCYRLVKYLSSLLCKLGMAGGCQLPLPLSSPSPAKLGLFSLPFTVCVLTGSPDVTTNLCDSADVRVRVCVKLQT